VRQGRRALDEVRDDARHRGRGRHRRRVAGQARHARRRPGRLARLRRGLLGGELQLCPLLLLPLLLPLLLLLSLLLLPPPPPLLLTLRPTLTQARKGKGSAKVQNCMQNGIPVVKDKCVAAALLLLLLL